MKIRLGTLLALAGVIAIGAAWGIPPATSAPRGAWVGQPAPEIMGGPWINSDALSLARLRGRVVFLDFWTYG